MSWVDVSRWTEMELDIVGGGNEEDEETGRARNMQLPTHVS
jgi:hypothetical protein